MKSGSRLTTLAPHNAGDFAIAFSQALCNSHGTQAHFALTVPSESNLQLPNKWSQAQNHSITALVLLLLLLLFSSGTSIVHVLCALRFVSPVPMIEFPPITPLVIHLHDQGIRAWLDHWLNLVHHMNYLS